MGLQAGIVRSVTDQISRQYPEMKGVKPKVQLQKAAKSASDQPVYLLIYQAKVANDAGKQIQRTVRVTVSGDGKIIRTSTSR
jgi:Tfp pilus assembly protein PilX